MLRENTVSWTDSIIWPTPCKNVSLGISRQRRPKSTCACMHFAHFRRQYFTWRGPIFPCSSTLYASLEGLSPFTWYVIAVRSRSGATVGPFGKPVIVQTKEGSKFHFLIILYINCVCGGIYCFHNLLCPSYIHPAKCYILVLVGISNKHCLLVISCILHHWDIQLTVGQGLLSLKWVSRVEGGIVLFLLFLHFLSFSSFSPAPLFHLLYYLSSPFLWEMTQNDQQRLTCH